MMQVITDNGWRLAAEYCICAMNAYEYGHVSAWYSNEKLDEFYVMN